MVLRRKGVVNVLIATELVFLCVLASLGIFAFANRGEPQASTSPLVFVGGLTLLFYVLKPLVNVYVFHQSFSGVEITSSDFSYLMMVALALCIVGVVGIYGGYTLRCAAEVSRHLPRWRFENTSANLLFAGLLGYLLILVAANCWVYLQYGTFPGISDLPRSETVASIPGKIAFVALLMGKFFFAAAILVLVKGKTWRLSLGKRVLLRSIATLLLVAILVSMILSASRTRFFELFIVAALIYSWVIRPISLAKLTLIGTALLMMAVVVYPAVFLLLVIFGGQDAVSVDLLERVAGSQQRLGDKIDTLMVVVDRMRAEGSWLVGGSALGFVGQFVTVLPRDESPFIHETQHFVQTYFPDAAAAGLGFPVPLFATLYWNLGLVGVLVGGGIFGYLLRVFYEYAKVSRDWGIVLYAAMIFSIYGFYGGSLSQAIAYNLVTVAGGLAFLTVICRGKISFIQASLRGGVSSAG